MDDLLGLSALLVTVLGALAGAFGFLWSEIRDLAERVRAIETALVLLSPLRLLMERKLHEGVEPILQRLE
jgi:hypothetical protein